MFKEPVCKYCGQKKKPMFNGYTPCTCEEAQAEYSEYSRAREKRNDCEFQLEVLNMHLDRMNSQAEKLFEQSNLGVRFGKRTFETFNSTNFEPAYKVSMDFVDTFEKNLLEQNGEGLLFLGQVGTGKTHLAAAIVNRIMSTYALPVRFITSIELFGILKDFDNQTEILTELKSIPLLVIDDLGKEKATDWNREKLFEIINSRYESCLPMVITSNNTPEELENNLGKATFSRICEMCKAVIMNGDDWRKK